MCKWLRVCEAMTEVSRLPATGPTVQKPMALARPIWGLKSRMRAGVATKTAPSTMPMAEIAMANSSCVWQFVTPKVTIRPMIKMP